MPWKFLEKNGKMERNPNCWKPQASIRQSYLMTIVLRGQEAQVDADKIDKWILYLKRYLRLATTSKFTTAAAIIFAGVKPISAYF